MSCTAECVFKEVGPAEFVCGRHMSSHACGAACTEAVVVDGAQLVCSITGTVLHSGCSCEKRKATVLRNDNDRRSAKRRKIGPTGWQAISFTPSIALPDISTRPQYPVFSRQRGTPTVRRKVNAKLELSRVTNHLHRLFAGPAREREAARVAAKRRKGMLDAGRAYLRARHKAGQCGNLIDARAAMAESADPLTYSLMGNDSLLFNEMLRVLAVYVRGAYMITYQIRHDLKAYFDLPREERSGTISNGQSNKCLTSMRAPSFIPELILLMARGGLTFRGRTLVPASPFCAALLPSVPELAVLDRRRKKSFKLHALLWLAAELPDHVTDPALTYERCMRGYETLVVVQHVRRMHPLSLVRLPRQEPPFWVVEVDGCEAFTVSAVALAALPGATVIEGPFAERTQAEVRVTALQTARHRARTEGTSDRWD